MMKKLDLAILVITILVTPTYSQTHTESTSHKWKGIDVNTVLGNDTYKDNNTIENGYPFILYNIGTGRFVIQGGDWAMEGRLFYPDFGRKMYLYSNGRINDLENTFDIPSADEPHFGIVTLEKLPYGTYQKNNYENCLKVGKELTQHANDHRQKVWVLVSQEDYDAGNRTIRLGFRKDEATMSGVINGGYYDTDWVCADDLRASYMGLSPVFFYEDEEDLNYLSHDERYRELFTANEYVPATLDGRYAGAANLQRKFTVGEWNTFAFPLPLTGEQIRYAFGDYSDLLKLNSIGGLSNNDCIIWSTNSH